MHWVPEEHVKVHAIVTSPPYYKMRNYSGDPNELGQEKTVMEYIIHLVDIFDNIRPWLRDDGTLWIVIGEKYLKGRPCRIADKLITELEIDKWFFLQDCHWYKNNIMTMGYKNRFITDSEKVLVFTKSKNKWYFQPQYEPYSLESWAEFGEIYKGTNKKDYAAAGAPVPGDVKRNIIKTMPPIGGIKNVGQASTYTGKKVEFNFGRGRLMRSTWLMNTQQYHGAHFAVYPVPLAARIILSAVPFKYCTHAECGKALKPVYTEWKIETRPGRGKRDASKSGTDADPNQSLHLSELSKKRIKITRWLTGYEKQCAHQNEFVHGVVLDPFMGVGSTAIAALQNGRHYIGIEKSAEYIQQAHERIALPKFSKTYYDFNRDDWQSTLETFMPPT